MQFPIPEALALSRPSKCVVSGAAFSTCPIFYVLRAARDSGWVCEVRQWNIGPQWGSNGWVRLLQRQVQPDWLTNNLR